MQRYKGLGKGLAAALLATLTVVGAGLAPAGATDSASGPSIAAIARRERAGIIARSRAAGSQVARAVTAQPKTVVTDTIGDQPFPAGDITSAGFGQNATGFVFSTNLLAPSNPATDQNWKDGLAFAGWAVEATGDGNAEWIILMFADAAGALSVELFSIDTDFRCVGTGTFVAGAGLRASFPATCALPITSFRLQAATGYTDDPEDTSTPNDVAPNVGYSAKVQFAGGAPAVGYWMLGKDGRVYRFGQAALFPGLVPGAVAIAAKPNGQGYWVARRDGSVKPLGTAANLGGPPRLLAGEKVVSISATPSGGGYWLFTNLGRVFAFGDAHLFGDLGGRPLNRPIVGSAATPTGLGYYQVAADGGVFAFGDAVFRGSMGGKHLNGRIVDMALSPDGTGYWLVGADGGVFTFRTVFRGSMGGHHLNKPVVAILGWGNGYLMFAADGGVFRFSERPGFGSLGDHPPASPITDAASLIL